MRVFDHCGLSRKDLIPTAIINKILWCKQDNLGLQCLRCRASPFPIRNQVLEGMGCCFPFSKRIHKSEFDHHRFLQAEPQINFSILLGKSLTCWKISESAQVRFWNHVLADILPVFGELCFYIGTNCASSPNVAYGKPPTDGVFADDGDFVILPGCQE